MRQLAPGKTLIEAPTAGNSATCKSCAHCPWMAMNALQGVVGCLETGQRRDPRARADPQPCTGLHRAHARFRQDASGQRSPSRAAVSCRTSGWPDEVRTQRDAGAGAPAQHRRRAARRPGHRRLDRPAGAGRPPGAGPGGGARRRGAVRPRLVRRRLRRAGPQRAHRVAVRRRRRHAGRQRGLPHPGRFARPADGRTAGAELPATAQRHGQRHAAPCACDRRRIAQPARLRHPGHAQDRAGPAPGAEVRGARRRRPEPAAGAVARHPDQGEPHRCGWRRAAGDAAKRWR